MMRMIIIIMTANINMHAPLDLVLVTTTCPTYIGELASYGCTPLSLRHILSMFSFGRQQKLCIQTWVLSRLASSSSHRPISCFITHSVHLFEHCKKHLLRSRRYFLIPGNGTYKDVYEVFVVPKSRNIFWDKEGLGRARFCTNGRSGMEPCTRSVLVVLAMI
jgi:hypothetical protein